VISARPTYARRVTATATLLAEVRDEPLSVADVLAAVAHPAAGGQAVFVGTVRDHDVDRPVLSLEYSAHPSADEVIREVAGRIAAEPGVLAVAVLHRVGALVVGDVAIVAAVSTAHRAEAFDGCRRLVDTVKHELPVWKLQRFADGTTEWVGSC
jgi:molybdopterin synthase catalytic subunit